MSTREGSPLLPQESPVPEYPKGSFWYNIDIYFKVTERGSTISTEIRSGIVTFFTMAYILILNAQILHLASKDPKNPMPFESIVTATAISSALASGLTGYLGNLPFGLAPGMGINTYFTYGLCHRLGFSWQVGLACSFVTGLLFLILSVTGACTWIQLYAPLSVKKGITVGLGLFQALIGFEMMKLVVRGEHTLLEMGELSDPAVLLSALGVILICALMVLNVNASMIIGLAVITILSWAGGLQDPPTAIASTPSLTSTFMAMDFTTYFDQFTTTLPVTLIILFVAVFDTAGVHYALGHQAGLLDEETHTLPGASGAFTSASIATMVGACVGTSPVIIHNESCAGIQDGARTGLNAVVIAICFVIALPFTPILAAVPAFASSSPLIVVGMLMMSASKFIEWTKIEEALPAFLTISVLPLTYSIANGMVAGILSYSLLKPIAMYAEARAARLAAEQTEINKLNNNNNINNTDDGIIYYDNESGPVNSADVIIHPNDMYGSIGDDNNDQRSLSTMHKSLDGVGSGSTYTEPHHQYHHPPHHHHPHPHPHPHHHAQHPTASPSIRSVGSTGSRASHLSLRGSASVTGSGSGSGSSSSSGVPRLERRASKPFIPESPLYARAFAPSGELSTATASYDTIATNHPHPHPHPHPQGTSLALGRTHSHHSYTSTGSGNNINNNKNNNNNNINNNNNGSKHSPSRSPQTGPVMSDMAYIGGYGQSNSNK